LNKPTNEQTNKGRNKSKMSDAVATLRNELIEIIGKNPNGHTDPKITEEFSSKLQAYADMPGVESSDVIFAIGSSVYGIDLPPKKKKQNTNGDNSSSSADEKVVVDFDYMKQFMKDVFLSYGCTEEQAEISSDVLIEADKRGIDSHGLGRLKPIYCDRMDKGILWANKPIDIVKETETTALVDGNLGLGLYIGPYCMKMAIEKAKKYGVGFVAAQNSTHYGIAGYYTTMATDAGCIGFSGTNARPSIAPTFGVEPMLGESSETKFTLCYEIYIHIYIYMHNVHPDTNNIRPYIHKYMYQQGPTHFALEYHPMMHSHLSLTVQLPSTNVERLKNMPVMA
jgi:Malate/L-lactate dehydrogenases